MKFAAGSILLILLVGYTSCKKKAPALSEEEVISVIRRFDDGWRNKNLKAVDSVLAPAYIYFTQSGGTFSRDGVVQTAGAAAYSLERMERSGFVVHLYENTAVVSTRWKGKGIYRGVPFDEDQRCSITVIKTGDKIEILSEHCTPINTSRRFH